MKLSGFLVLSVVLLAVMTESRYLGKRIVGNYYRCQGFFGSSSGCNSGGSSDPIELPGKFVIAYVHGFSCGVF